MSSLIKEHLFSNDPFVATYTDILSDTECQHFIDLSKDRLKKSLVSDGKKGVVSSGRTSSNTWIRHDHDSITKEVGERIAKKVGMPLENAEAFQLIYYGITQEYRQHYDSWEHDDSEKTLRCMKYGGARMITALCYLNNVTKGGGTKMTKLNITIPAIKGKMLVFHNTISLNNHDRHPLSEHAGLPVEEGEKYAFNLWFKECHSKMLYRDFNPSYYEKKQLSKFTYHVNTSRILKEVLNANDYIESDNNYKSNFSNWNTYRTKNIKSEISIIPRIISNKIDDKIMFYKILLENNIDIYSPKTYLNFNDINYDPKKIYFLKSSHQSGGKGVYVVNSLKTINDIISSKPGNYLLQEEVPNLKLIDKKKVYITMLYFIN